MADEKLVKPCCGYPLLGPHVGGCEFEPREDNAPDYRGLFEGAVEVPALPKVSIELTRQLNAGIAAQLRVLADLLDPPKGH